MRVFYRSDKTTNDHESFRAKICVVQRFCTGHYYKPCNVVFLLDLNMINVIVWLKASPQLPNIPLYKESEMFSSEIHPSPLVSIEMLGEKLYYKPPTLGVTVPTLPLRKPTKWWPLPREDQDHSHRLFKLPSETNMWSPLFPLQWPFWFFFPLSVFSWETPRSAGIH